MTLTGSIKKIDAKTLVSGDVGLRLIVDVAPGADLASLYEYMGHALTITLEAQ